MPWQRPTLAEIKTRVEADLSSRLLKPGKTLLRVSVIRAIAAVIAGAAHLLYGFLAWLALQLFADTAEKDALVRKASIDGVDLKEATFAQGTFLFTGTDDETISAGTTFVRADGVEYTTDADGTIDGGGVLITGTCSTAGATGDCDSGTKFTLLAAIPGVDSELTANDGIEGGNDEETVEELRARYIEQRQEQPQGGADADYKKWAKEVAGVTRAWVIPLYLGSDTVGVLFVRDDDGGGIIPDGGEVTAVQAHIDPLAPVTATVYVLAPTPVALDLTITATPDTAGVRAAIQAEIEDLLRREAAPGGTILLSHIQEAISVAAGETDHLLSVPSADVTHTALQIPILGTITWI